MQAVNQQLQERHFKQFSHKPTIDAISSRLARPKTDGELSSNPCVRPALSPRLSRNGIERVTEGPEPSSVS